MIAASAPSPLWYLTRGSGIVTLVLLTASICLGVASAVGWRGRSAPRFLVAGLHRNLTLLAVVFLSIHVTTTVVDAFTPIGVRDALVPFVSSYRPIWLGLGALASDLLLALVLTSLMRARVGYRAWRATHWLAYAAWPLALVHALGTGSDARFGWMAGLALACVLAVTGSVALRALHGGASPASQAAVGAAVLASLAVGIWYRSGPSQHGWAARAGTPRTLLALAVAPTGRTRSAERPASLPSNFDAALSGQLNQSLPDGSGMITLNIDATLRGGVRGELRLALRGAPSDGGGVVMTSSGAAFAAAGVPSVYEGSIVALQGTRVVAKLSAPAAGSLRLAMVLRIDPGSGAVSGSLQGART